MNSKKDNHKKILNDAFGNLLDERNDNQIYYGQFETDKIINSYFPNEYIGNCIEVGASDGIKGSNTLYFEKRGWFCLCIEPIPEYADKCRKNGRKNVLELACSNKNEYDVPFTVYDIGKYHILSSVSAINPDIRLIKEHKNIINEKKIIEVTVQRLDRILNIMDNIFLNKFDFISIDTEGTELDVLQGFDLNKWKPKLLIIENNFEDPEIEEYLKQFNYIKNQRYKINDFYVRGAMIKNET